MTTLSQYYTTAPVDELLYHTLEIVHPSFIDAASQPFSVRLVRDYAPLAARLEATAPLNPGADVVFSAAGFELTLPDIADNGRQGEASISIAALPAEIEDAIAAAAMSGEAVTLIYRIYHSADLTTPAQTPPARLYVSSVEPSAAGTRVVAAFRRLAGTQVPREYDLTPEAFNERLLSLG